MKAGLGWWYNVCPDGPVARGQNEAGLSKSIKLRRNAQVFKHFNHDVNRPRPMKAQGGGNRARALCSSFFCLQEDLTKLEEKGPP